MLHIFYIANSALSCCYKVFHLRILILGKIQQSSPLPKEVKVSKHFNQNSDKAFLTELEKEHFLNQAGTTEGHTHLVS